MKTLIFATIAMGLFGCGQLGPLTNTETETSSKSDEDGVTTGSIASDGGTLTVNDDSEVAGAEVSIPPGALAVATEITVEPGSSLVADGAGSDLGLDDDNSVDEAGPAVAILPSTDVDPTQPLTLAIPLSSSAALLQENFAVLFKTRRANGDLYIGVITGVTNEGDKLRFDATHFGVFQAIKLAKALEKDIEVKTHKPIAVKRKATELQGTWDEGCRNETNDAGVSEGSDFGAIVFSNDQFRFRQTEFRLPDCKGRVFTADFAAKFSIGEPSSVVDGAKDLDVEINAVYLTLHIENMATKFSAASGCDIDQWNVNEPQSVGSCDLEKELNRVFEEHDGNDEGDDQNTDNDGTTSNSDGDNHDDQDHEDDKQSEEDHCKNDDKGGPPTIGEKIYTIFKIDGDKLSLGGRGPDCFAENSPETRSPVLEDKPFTRRK